MRMPGLGWPVAVRRCRRDAKVGAAYAVAVCLALGGCGVAAAPCRVTSAALDMIPLVGHTAAVPTDDCAQAIDP
jgi:hypothetical protein